MNLDYSKHDGSLNLTSAYKLVLPTTIVGNLWLSRLKSAEGLVFPSTIKGDLDLSSLTSADGLILTTSIGGALYLDKLRSADGLVLPDNFKFDRLYTSDEVKRHYIDLIPREQLPLYINYDFGEFRDYYENRLMGS